MRNLECEFCDQPMRQEGCSCAAARAADASYYGHFYALGAQAYAAGKPRDARWDNAYLDGYDDARMEERRREEDREREARGNKW